MNYDDHVRVAAIPDYGRGALTGNVRRVTVSGKRLLVSESADVTHVFRAIDAALDFSKRRKLYLGPSYAVLVRDEDAPREDGDGELLPPEDDDIAPADLSTIEDGDTVHVYRLPEERRPGYSELVEEVDE